MAGASEFLNIRRPHIPLAAIDAAVAAHLGPGRVPGNEREPCFSRQVSMYLAKYIGRWSTSKIGKFYNGRHHTTVLHAINKINRLRNEDESVQALIDLLSAALCNGIDTRVTPAEQSTWHDKFAEMVATRVAERLERSLGARTI